MTWEESAADAFHDFKRWLMRSDCQTEENARQCVRRVEEIWKSLDGKMEMQPSKLADAVALEDVYFYPLKERLEHNANATAAEQKAALQPSTIRTHLGSLAKFVKFSEARTVYCGMSLVQMRALERKISELCGSLKNLAKQRERDVSEWKCDNLLSPSDVKMFCQSEFVQTELQYVRSLVKGSVGADKEHAVAVRNIIMVQVCLMNACRASNLQNITLLDVDDAKEDVDFPGSWNIKSTRYKTSMLYGTKMITLTADLYGLLKYFVSLLRPVLVDDKMLASERRYLFVSSRPTLTQSGCPMSHSLISNCLSSAFRASGVLDERQLSDRVSPSRIRASVATELAGAQGQCVKDLAEHFMKHNEATCKKYYVQKWSQKKSVAMSVKCHDVFQLSSGNSSSSSSETGNYFMLAHMLHLA